MTDYLDAPFIGGTVGLGVVKGPCKTVVSCDDGVVEGVVRAAGSLEVLLLSLIPASRLDNVCELGVSPPLAFKLKVGYYI